MLLVHLSEADDGLAQLDLADRAGVTGPTLVKQIDQLEAAGLVERREDDRDRRVKRVSLTRDGHRLFKDVDQIAAGLRQEVLSGVDADDVATVLRVTNQLIRQFDDLQKTPAEGAA